MLKIFDVILLLLTMTIITVMINKLYYQSSDTDSAIVEIQTHKGIYLYPLNQDRILNIEGYLGNAEIMIKDKKVDVLKDPSQKQICVNQLPISQINSFLICLPNKIFITIKPLNSSSQNIDSTVF